MCGDSLRLKMSSRSSLSHVFWSGCKDKQYQVAIKVSIQMYNMDVCKELRVNNPSFVVSNKYYFLSWVDVAQ